MLQPEAESNKVFGQQEMELRTGAAVNQTGHGHWFEDVIK